jgi:alkylated DNA repair protein (DNA oxidative demethylase)
VVTGLLAPYMGRMQADLFSTPAIAGLDLAPDVIGPAQERELIRRIDAVALSPFRFQGWLGKRLTRSFGWSYDFDRGVLEQGDPLPDWLLPLRAAAADFANLPEQALGHALLIRYDPGAGIGWHKDRPAFEHVIGVSLGAPCTMRFRRRRPGGFDRRSVSLEPRSAYLLTDEVRHGWEHSIAPMEETRWSVTFRSLVAR